MAVPGRGWAHGREGRGVSTQRLPEVGAPPHRPTCKGVGVGQVVTRQVHEGAMLGVHELRLRGHVAGVLHGTGRVDHVHLQQTQWQPERAWDGHAAQDRTWSAPPQARRDRCWRADKARERLEATAATGCCRASVDHVSVLVRFYCVL